MDVYVSLVPTVSSRLDHCESEVCVARHYIIAATDNSLFTITHSISRLLHARCMCRCTASANAIAWHAIYANFGHIEWTPPHTIETSRHRHYIKAHTHHITGPHKNIDKKKEWKKESPTKETVRQRKREVKYGEAK